MNASSPVMLMIDDLTNVWVDTIQNGKLDPEEDWGYGLDGPCSSFAYLNNEILSCYPEVKVTFFSPLYKAPFIASSRYKTHFGPLDETEKSREFFRSVHLNPKFEIAYHGISHGITGKSKDKFIQEWLSYKSLEEALVAVKAGIKKFYNIFGEFPRGGKYCGYRSNCFSDESINQSGFFWWCRKWNRGDEYAGEKDRFKIGYFGSNEVIDIPSTLAGSLFNFHQQSIIRRIVKSVIGRKYDTLEDATAAAYAQIDGLLSAGDVISIQEHMAPARTDGKRQSPNIFDDRESLHKIFSYLKDKNVWFATGSEIAEYFELYNKCEIHGVEKGCFLIAYKGRHIKNSKLTVKIEGQCSSVICPDGSVIHKSIIPGSRTGDNYFNIPVNDGIYRTESIMPEKRFKKSRGLSNVY